MCVHQSLHVHNKVDVCDSVPAVNLLLPVRYHLVILGYFIVYNIYGIYSTLPIIATQNM